MSIKRKQARSLEPEDQFVLDGRIAFEVLSKTEGGFYVQLTVRPIPCGVDCSDECECLYRLFAGSGMEFLMPVQARRRLPYLGNMTQDVAELQKLQQRVKALQQARSVQQNGRKEVE